MVEKILILINTNTAITAQKAQSLKEILKRWGVAVVDITGAEGSIPFGELSVRYNMIIVSKRFCGQTSATARLVRRIRTEFFDPMIALDTEMGWGGWDDLFPLQVAGCNFILELGDWGQVVDQVCKAVEKIEPLLNTQN